MIEPQVDDVESITGIEIKRVTADGGYAYAKVYGALERRGIDALLPVKAEPINRYDAKHDILKCPAHASRKRVHLVRSLCTLRLSN